MIRPIRPNIPSSHVGFRVAHVLYVMGLLGLLGWTGIFAGGFLEGNPAPTFAPQPIE